MPHAQPSPYYYLILILIALPLIYWRMRRMPAAQPLKLNVMWIRPAIFLVLAGVVLATTPPQWADVQWLALAALLGAAAGYVWGRSMAIHVHPEDGTLMATGGQSAMIVLLGLVLVRMGLNAGLRFEAEEWHIDVVLISDASIVFAAFLFAARGLEMFLRARRVMAEHKATLPPPAAP